MRILELEEIPATATASDQIYSVACVRWIDIGLALLSAAIARVRKFSTAYGTDDLGGEEFVRALLSRLAVDMKDLDLFVAHFLRGRKSSVTTRPELTTG